MLEENNRRLALITETQEQKVKILKFFKDFSIFMAVELTYISFCAPDN